MSRILIQKIVYSYEANKKLKYTETLEEVFNDEVIDLTQDEPPSSQATASLPTYSINNRTYTIDTAAEIDITNSRDTTSRTTTPSDITDNDPRCMTPFFYAHQYSPAYEPVSTSPFVAGEDVGKQQVK